MPTMREFLGAVLPIEGRYCLVALDPEKKFKRQEFFDDVERLVRRIAHWDRYFSGGRGAVYHACSSFAGNNRLQTSVRAVRALWLDCDYGPNHSGDASKRYPDVATTLDAIAVFVGRTGLPVPLVVSSGNGVHAYWPLKENLTREQWQPYADGLKAAGVLHGLRADPARTADPSSILRPVDTTNRKYAPAQVVSGPLVGPYNIALFAHLIGAGGVHVNDRVHRVSLAPRSLNGKPQSALLRKLLNVTSPERIDFNALTRGCAQLRQFEQSRGNISEPEWYAAIGALAFVYEGDRVIHEWSSGHPKYTFEETADRISRVKQLSGPTTCAKFKSLNKFCEGCAFGQNTPLDAGRLVTSPPQQPRLAESNQTVSAETPTEASLDGPALEGHPEYIYVKGALTFRQASQTGPPIVSTLSAFPVRLSSIHTGEITKAQHYYLINHYHPHDGWKDVELKASDMHSQTMVAKLSDAGVVIHDPLRFSKFIRDSADVIRKREKTGMAYEQFGWKENDTAFLYGDRLYSATERPTPAIHEELRNRCQWLRPAPGGSVEGWKQAVDNLMGKGSEGMSFTVLASFASLFMRFLDKTEGGAVIQLVTRHAGAGKSTSLSGALSVWATDKRGLELTTIDTKVSKGKSLGLLCNLPVLYDEFQNKDPAMVREFLIMYTSGRDKMRANTSGQLLTNAISWNNLLITAGNQSMTETIMATNESNAPAARVLELPIESSGEMKQSELIRLAETLSNNGGHAGDAFLRYLMLPGVIPWVKENLLKSMDHVMEQCAFEKEHRFWARTLAATQIASLLVAKAGLITFSPDRIMDWAFHHFSQKVISKEERLRERSMIPVLAEYLAENLDATLTMPGAPDRNRRMPPIGEMPKRRVAVRVEADTGTAIIAIKPLRWWLEKHAGGGFQDMLTEAYGAGLLKQHYTLRTLTAGTEILGGQVPCIAVDIEHPSMTGVMRVVREAVHSQRAYSLR